MTEFLLIFLLLVFAAPAAYCVYGAIAAHVEAVEYGETAMCTPTRRANITASQPQTQRERLAVLLGRIDAEQVATLPLPAVAETQQLWRQPAADYAVPRPVDVDAIKAGSITYDLASLAAPAVPELPPVAPVVEEEQEQGIPVDWPTRIVQPVPLTCDSATVIRGQG